MTKPTHICQIKPVKQNLSSQIYQTKPSKPSLPNHTYKTNSTKPNLQNQTYQIKPTKPNQNYQRNKSKAPKLNSSAKLANPNVNQSQISLSLLWAWHSSAPACSVLHWLVQFCMVLHGHTQWTFTLQYCMLYILYGFTGHAHSSMVVYSPTWFSISSLPKWPKNVAFGENCQYGNRTQLLEDKTSLSWLVPSSVVWVEVELSQDWVELRLSCSWIWVDPELGKYLNSLIEVFEVFNWSIWSLVPFYYFTSGCLGG